MLPTPTALPAADKTKPTELVKPPFFFSKNTTLFLKIAQDGAYYSGKISFTQITFSFFKIES